MPDTPASRRWRALVDAHACSGLTTREFARREGVNPRTLAWWRWNLRRGESAVSPVVRAPEFTEVWLEPSEPGGSVVLAFDSLKVHVVVDAQTDLALLRRVAEAFA